MWREDLIATIFIGLLIGIVVCSFDWRKLKKD